MKSKILKEEFLDKVKNPNYSFVNTIFINMQTPIEVECMLHGAFTILPTNMLYKKEGCKFCGIEKMSKSKSLTKEEFIERAKKLYGEKYDYSLVDYKNNKTKIIVICKDCGEQLYLYPNNFLANKCKHKCKK